MLKKMLNEKGKLKEKGKEKVVDVEEDAERKRKVKVKGKEKLVDSEKGSEKNKRINKQKHNSVLKGRVTVRQLFEAMHGLGPERKKLTYLHYTKFDMLKVKRRLSAFKSWNTSLLKKREIAELQNDYMGIGEIQDDVGEGEEPNQKEELYEMLEENINNILIEKSEIEEKINESLIKFQDDEKLLQLKQRMKDIFKEPDMPEYLSSSSSESDDDNDDGSQLADENEESYRKETHSNDEDDVEIIAEVQKDERNETHYTAECKNEEEIIRKGPEFSFEIRKKAQQQEREQKRKGKKEKDQIGSSSQASPIFGIENSLQVDPAVELTKDEKLLGRSIFSTQEEKEEEVFNDNEGLILFRMNVQSLAPGLEIDTSVIDVYVSILNYEEKFKMTNMKRHFFYTSMMVPGILEDKTKEINKKIDAQYDRFHEMLLIQMENDVEKMQMEDVELAFFPIIAHGHYYLIVFNLKIRKTVIIDNSESDATYEGKYKDNVEFVLYEGSTATQWKTGLLPENDKNHRMQMDNLRSRIAAKILLHEVNIYQKKMSDYVKKMTEAGE
ncbi:peptidase C48, SUMO/sentrin/Ubl1 [Tanacetum coccineum]